MEDVGANREDKTVWNVVLKVHHVTFCKTETFFFLLITVIEKLCLRCPSLLNLSN